MVICNEEAGTFEGVTNILDSSLLVQFGDGDRPEKREILILFKSLWLHSRSLVNVLNPRPLLTCWTGDWQINVTRNYSLR